ncbi:hypothetical protein [Prosthecobacter sp.]|uniref:hypothetical protein n=1 Tax=Prosthecobacter sp. TaxID=1965333 RepID=UPI003783FEC5
MFGFFDAPSIPAAQVWLAIHSYMEEIGVAKTGYDLSPGIGKRRGYRERYLDRRLIAAEIAEELSKDDNNGYTIDHGVRGQALPLQHFVLRPSPNQRVGFQMLDVRTGTSEDTIQDWTPLVERLTALGNLVWLGNTCTPYIAWQNCSIPQTYEKQYGSIVDFETYELHGDVTLNVRRNPGSNHMHDGVMTRANSELWLGPQFWNFAPCTKEEVLAADFFLEKRDTLHYLYLKSWPHPFTRPDGEQGRVQQKLWRLLYKQDCEWPPGSGGISDVPVGGPPELMP